MADLGYDFDAGSVEPRDNFEPIPAGLYNAEVSDSEVVDTKAGTGKILKLTLRVTDGPCTGRQIWENINFRNSNETAQKIGQQQLAELCSACGIRGPLRDTTYLHGVPIRVRVKIEEDKSGQYGPRNKVARFMSMQDGEAAAPPPRPAAVQSAPQRAAAGGGSLPWKR